MTITGIDSTGQSAGGNVPSPRQVTDPFYEVQSKLKGEIEAADRMRAEAREKADKEQRAYIANLQRLAGQETIIV